MTNLYGLSTTEWNTLTNILKQYTSLQEVILFGSRARGNFRPQSDIDLALTSLFPEKTLTHLQHELEESTLPYTVDLINYKTLSSEALKQEIDQYGKILAHSGSN